MALKILNPNILVEIIRQIYNSKIIIKIINSISKKFNSI